MKNINRTLRSLAAAAVAAVAFVSQSQAAPLVYVDPASQNTAGPTATIGIYVSGLTQATGGVSFSLGFDGAILSGLGGSYTVDPTGGMGVAVGGIDFSAGFGPGSLSVDFLSDPTISEAALFAAEGSGTTPFKLASITFAVVGNGLSGLTLSNVALSDYAGLINLASTTQNGQICVPANCVVVPPAVPEPTSVLLVAAAMGALALQRKKTTV